MSNGLIELTWAGRPVQVEVQWIAASMAERPLMVFLHEGLGSVSMWRDFPRRVCEALGMRGLVYSRPGYGRSTPRASEERWGTDFMHRQAFEVLPAVLAALGVNAPERPWLLGHSDGASIALLYATRFGQRLSGCIAMAPHIMVEPISLKSIELARQAYEQGKLREGLARHHINPDSAFWGWNHAWLAPEFAAWSIESELNAIQCPLLAVQGQDDEYGTLEQIRGIARRAPQTRLVELPQCGHSPHRDQPEAVMAAIQSFVAAS
jgi:pimeloyl-ACP methyl ester carboxylesterase